MKITTCLRLAMLLLAGVPAAVRGEDFRTDINPALIYYQAFLLEPARDADYDYLFTNNWQVGQLPEHFGKLIARYHGDLTLWQRAAKQTAPCDWGIDLSPGPETLLPELAYCKRAAQAERLHAMWQLQQGDEAGAAGDLLAALAAGRYSSRDGTLIGVLVQIAVENIVVATVAENFQRFSPPTLRVLADGFDTAPARRTIGDCLAAEKFIAGHWVNAQIQKLQQAHPDDETAVMQGMQRLIENLGPEDDTNYWQELTNAAGGTVSGLVKMTQVSAAFADQLVPILLLPHGAFEPRFQAFYDEVKQSGDFLFGDTLGAFAASRRKEFTVQAELAMVRAAIEYKLHGDAGLQKVMDPEGNGPFTCERFLFKGVDRGFRLKSAYVPASTPSMMPWSSTGDNWYTNAPSRAPVTMIFVEKDGPAFNVLGNHAGEPVTP